MSRRNTSSPIKISAAFSARLDALAPSDTVRALVLLDTAREDSGGRRSKRSDRQTAVETVRQAAERAFRFLDETLDSYPGRRLAAKASALGTVPVETTRDGIRALADSGWVKAVLEDQKVSLAGT
jgi:hypothetical protein